MVTNKSKPKPRHPTKVYVGRVRCMRTKIEGTHLYTMSRRRLHLYRAFRKIPIDVLLEGAKVSKEVRTYVQLNKLKTDVTMGTQRFTMFRRLLRYRAFRKMPIDVLLERAKVSKEVRTYVKLNKLKTDVTMGLVEEEGVVYVKIYLDCLDYTQMVRLPEDMAKMVRQDLLSSVGCMCALCDRKAPNAVTMYYDYVDLETLFAVFGLVHVTDFNIKSTPTQGLVDLLQPPGIMVHSSEFIRIVLHPLPGVDQPRKYPNLSVENWGRWLEWCRPTVITIETNVSLYREDYDYEAASIIFLDPDILDSSIVRNARTVDAGGWIEVDFTYGQISSMKANRIELGSSPLISRNEIRKFFQAKIQLWMDAPETRMKYAVESEEEEHDQMYNYYHLLKPFEDLLLSDRFLIYPKFTWGSNFESTDCITIRSVTKKTRLTVTPNGLYANDYDGLPINWPLPAFPEAP